MKWPVLRDNRRVLEFLLLAVLVVGFVRVGVQIFQSARESRESREKSSAAPLDPGQGRDFDLLRDWIVHHRPFPIPGDGSGYVVLHFDSSVTAATPHTSRVSSEAQRWMFTRTDSRWGKLELELDEALVRSWLESSKDESAFCTRLAGYAMLVHGLVGDVAEDSRVIPAENGSFAYGWGLDPEGLAVEESSHCVRWKGRKKWSRAIEWGLREDDLILGLGRVPLLRFTPDGHSAGGNTLRALCGFPPRSTEARDMTLWVYRDGREVPLAPECVPVRISDGP